MLATLDDALEIDKMPPSIPLGPTIPTGHSTDQVAAASPFSMSSGNLLKGGRTQDPPGQAPKKSESAQPATLNLEQLEAKAAAASNVVAPACLPYDSVAFLARLQSFRTGGHWFDKPSSVSPLVCARYGWCLEGFNLLACSVCGGCIKAPQQLTASGADDVLARQLHSQLTSAHTELCPWRGHPSPSSVGALLLPAESGSQPSLPQGLSIGLEELRRRAATLLALPALPMLAPAANAGWEACARACGFTEPSAWRAAILALAGFDRQATSLSTHETERRWIASALALLGWNAGSVPNTLECAEDALAVGLWDYEKFAPAGQPLGEAVGGTLGGGGAATSAPAPLFGMPVASEGTPRSAALPVPPSGRKNGAALFDPIAGHRSWSPWTATCAGDTIPTWMRIAVLLMPPGAPGRQSTLAEGSASVSAVSRLLGSF